MVLRLSLAIIGLVAGTAGAPAAPVLVHGKPARLEIRSAGDRSVRITLQPLDAAEQPPFSPTVAERAYPEPALRLEEIAVPVKTAVGKLFVEVRSEPVTVTVTDEQGRVVQELAFLADGKLSFAIDDQPILGLGEGGPLPRGNWREAPVQFNRNGAFHEMRPRWQSDAYGSRNPVALLVGTSGWAMFVAAPWGSIDLREAGRGALAPWTPPPSLAEQPPSSGRRGQNRARAARVARCKAARPKNPSSPGPMTCSSSTPATLPRS